MSGRLIALAAAFAHQIDDATPARVFATSRELRNAIAPRMSAVRPLDARTLELVAPAPTAWCTADLHVVDAPATAVLRRVPGAFPQLRRIQVSGSQPDSDALAGMLAGVCRADTIREVAILDGMTHELSVTDAVLVAIAPLAARLETLVLTDCSRVAGNIAAHLRNLPRLRVLRIDAAVTMTDAHLAAILAESVILESLTVTEAPLLTGDFLKALPEECRFRMRTLTISGCNEFDDAGAAHLACFLSLETMCLQYCAQLTSLTRLPQLRGTGDSFLRDCTALTTIDLSGFAGIREVGSSFIRCARALTTLDLGALSNVTALTDNFLSFCSGLQHLDLRPLKNVVRIGDAFLWGARGLVTLDLSPLRLVGHLGSGFLQGCSRLATVDMSGMNDVVVVGRRFLSTHGPLLRRLRLSDALLRHPEVSDEHKRLHVETGCPDAWREGVAMSAQV